MATDTILGTLQSLAGMAVPAHDYVAVTYPNSTTEVYTYKSGGAAGTSVGTVTIVYTDAAKNNVSTITKA